MEKVKEAAAALEKAITAAKKKGFDITVSVEGNKLSIKATRTEQETISADF